MRDHDLRAVLRGKCLGGQAEGFGEGGLQGDVAYQIPTLVDSIYSSGSGPREGRHYLCAWVELVWIPR